jgi:hypothetical protein
MFSKKPATPPRLWSKWSPSLRGLEMVCPVGVWQSVVVPVIARHWGYGSRTFNTFSYSFAWAL